MPTDARAPLLILTVGDPRLREVARPLSLAELATAEVQDRIDHLVETMHAAHGAGLAAPQVGWGVAVAAIHVQDNPRYPYKPNVPLTVLVNPALTVLGDEARWLYEGCLSVPDLRGRVKRAMRVKVEAWDRHGAPVCIEARGLTAGTFQHEVDHLLGRLFLDGVKDPTTFCTWAHFDAHHRDAFVAEAAAIAQRFGG